MTVFDRIKTMSKDELQKLILSIYTWGAINERCNSHNKHYYEHLLDLDASCVDDIINMLDTLELYEVKAFTLLERTPQPKDYYPITSTKFFSVDDAAQFIIKYGPKDSLHKVDELTYESFLNLFKIVPCNHMR
jgi:hypothetical protein